MILNVNGAMMMMIFITSCDLSFLLNIELELIIYWNVMSITMNHFEYYVMMEYSVMFSDACNSTQYLDLYMNFMIMDIS